MTEEQKRKQKKKLDAVSDPEWERALKTLADYITWKLGSGGQELLYTLSAQYIPSKIVIHA